MHACIHIYVYTHMHIYANPESMHITTSALSQMHFKKIWPYLGPHIVIFFSCFYLQCPRILVAEASTISRNETDRLALLEFKANTIEDPLGILVSWNESANFCQWHGVTCSSRHQRVTILDLRSSKLTGTISPHIGNLSFLRELHLQNNSFTNIIPPEIGRLRRLQILNLQNNSITGQIPGNLSGCSNLVLMNLIYNQLAGEIPSELGTLSKLEFLSLSANNLTGSIPASFGNLSSLDTLSLSRNNLNGNIPESLGQLKNLLFLALGGNWLSGTIPPSIFNLSSITTFDVGTNQIQGSLPTDLGTTLPNLRVFRISSTQIDGKIPDSVSNASNMEEFQASEAKLSGGVPFLGNLHRLVWFIVTDNNLGSGGTNDLGFLLSLTNATRLEALAINANNFGGLLPEYASNLSSTLQYLFIDNNKIFGTFPSWIGKFVNLLRLDMWNNQFSGSIQQDIGKLKNLGILYLDGNRLSGNVPSSIGNLTRLTLLDLSGNILEGKIPSSLGECENLAAFDFSYNNLTGSIPPEIMNLPSLSIYFDLSGNQLTGPLPVEIGKLGNIGGFIVSMNMFSGEIPSSLGSCIRLEFLEMQGNFFEGPIPSSLSSLRGLRILDLSRNNLSGEVPEFLAGFDMIQNLNLSNNNFEGAVPIDGVFKNASAVSLTGNDNLCGGIPEFQLPTCISSKPKKRRLSNALILIIAVVSGILVVTLVPSLLFICFTRKKREKRNSTNSKDSLLKLSYRSLYKATNGFSPGNLIGVGSFGSVYKGYLDQGRTIIAVKVLNLMHREASKSFTAECEVLRSVRHRNLVKVLSACSGFDYQGNDFKAVIYEFMANGSLEEWLHPSEITGEEQEATKTLNLLQRLNIAVDVAFALDYLHNHCQPPIAHCDIKPSNVLLDDGMNGHVSDFGLARFLPRDSHRQTSSLAIRGSIGYAAPEYGMGSEASSYGDVYSFGILLLEMFTGKRPTNDMFKDGLNLHAFVKDALRGQVTKIIDSTLLHEMPEGKMDIDNFHTEGDNQSGSLFHYLASIFDIAIACSNEVARGRMNINDAATGLQAIREKFSGIHQERVTTCVP